MAKVKKLTRKFYTQPTLKIAKDLLGKYIVRKVGKRELVGKIIETEAYIGPQDRASHAFGGKRTSRNQAEYLIGGHIYIYLVYGMYWQLNISTFENGEPECVLIRAIEPVLNNSKLKIDSWIEQSERLPVRLQLRIKNLKLANGPGKLCRYLKLDKPFYGEDVTKSKRIWLEDRGLKPQKILATGRIGIDYAGLYWSRRKWRFLIKDYQKLLA